MEIISIIVAFFTISTLVIVLVFQFLAGDVSGKKLMLLGINITLFGGILLVDPNYNHGGIAYIIALAGLIFTIIGFGIKDCY